MFYKRDPGPCPVDDAPHTTCCAPTTGPITVVQLPARDGVVEPPLVGAVHVPLAVHTPPMPQKLLGEVIQETLPPGPVTTATYRKRRVR